MRRSGCGRYPEGGRGGGAEGDGAAGEAHGDGVVGSGFDGDEEALPIRTDARVLGATLKAGESAEYALDDGHHAYLVPATGTIEINGVRIDARDGAAIADETRLTITAIEDAEIVLVDAA